MNDMKQQELADKSGVSKNSISQYLSQRSIPSNISAGKMATVLGVNPMWLMGYDIPMNRTNVQSSHKEFNIDDFDSIKSKKLVSSIIINAKKLNDSGKQNLLDYSNILLGNPAFVNEPEPYVNAAHMRTDIKLDKNDDDPYDDKIMDDENF